MNFVWPLVILAALACTVGLFVVATGVILFLTRRWRWWVRTLLVFLPGIALGFLWSIWLGPHELTDKKELAERFELVFQFPPGTYATDIRYQLADGPDAVVEWFRFQVDDPQLEKIVKILVPISGTEFAEMSSSSPRWWLLTATEDHSYFRGSIDTPTGSSPFSREAWIAHDPKNKVVYCYIVSHF